MTRKLVVPFLVTILGLLTICAPIFAHHGTAGVFDHGHRITTKATVTQYIWANPHVQIHFTLKNDKGEEETWGAGIQRAVLAIPDLTPGEIMGVLDKYARLGS